MLDISFCDQDIHLSFAGVWSSFLTEGASNNSSFLPCFLVHFVLLRILFLLTGCHLNLLRTFDLYYTSIFSVAHFLDSQLSKLLLWNTQAQCYGSLLQESSEWLFTWRYLFMRADGSWAEGPSLIPSQHPFKGSAHPGQDCPLLLPGLHGATGGPFLPCPSLWMVALPLWTLTGSPLLGVICSLDGTSPPCCITSSWDSLCKMHFTPQPIIIKQ